MNNYYYKPRGLANFSCNCYMNSLVQCLYYCKEFRNKILEIDFYEENSMVLIFKKLFNELKTSKKNIIYPLDLKEKLNNNELFKNGTGADVVDLLDFLFNSIIYELKPEISNCETVNYENKIDNKLAMLKEAKEDISTKTILDDIFLGIYEKEFFCKNNHLKYSFQIEYRILFSLESISNFTKKNEFDLSDCFDYSYLNPEKTQENCYYSYCNREMKLIEKIYENPKILIIILDRGFHKKYDKKVTFKLEIDISKYVDQSAKNSSNIYRLIGVSTHRGINGNGGHYTSICLCDDDNYYSFNDTIVNRLDPSHINDILQQNSPYILFYRREDNNRGLSKNTKSKNKKNEVISKSIIDIMAEQIKTYLKSYEFQKINKNEYQCSYKDRKIIFKIEKEQANFLFEEKKQKIKCCDVEVYNNKSSFSLKLSEISNDSFMNVFKERFISFFQVKY